MFVCFFPSLVLNPSNICCEIVSLKLFTLLTVETFKLGNVESHHSERIGILQKYCCSSCIYDSLNDFYFSLDITHLLTLTYKTTVLIFLSTQFLNSFGFIFLFLAIEDCKDGTQIIQFFKQCIPVKKYISFKVWNSSRCWAPAMPITWNFTLPLLQLQWWRLEKQKHSANLVAWKWPPLDKESNLVYEECIGSDQEQTRGENNEEGNKHDWKNLHCLYLKIP